MFELLPLVGHALARAGVDDPGLGRARGLRRHTFVTNELLVEQLCSALEVLDAAAVPTLVLKGIPLAHSYYPHVGLRPMGDVDVLVPRDAARIAVAALGAAGWHADRPLPNDFRDRYAEAHLRREGRRHPLDLHWRLVPWIDRRGHGQEEGLWAAARCFEIAGRSSLAPSPDDLLMHVILHAFRSGWAAVPRWVADVAMIVRSAGDAMNWDRFVERALRGAVASPVRDALDYAVAVAELAVPAGVVQTLGGARRRRSFERRYAIGSRPLTSMRSPVTGQLDDVRTIWSRHTVNMTVISRARYLRPFVLARTGTDDLRSLPGVVRRHRRQQNAADG